MRLAPFVWTKGAASASERGMRGAGRGTAGCQMAVDDPRASPLRTYPARIAALTRAPFVKTKGADAPSFRRS